jgi:holo-[acyl-carrier protein] synthase
MGRPPRSWAAKEAAIKAHPHLRLSRRDIVITAAKNGPPQMIVYPGDGRVPQAAQLSISHDGEYAIATCLGFRDDAGSRAAG